MTGVPVLDDAAILAMLDGRALRTSAAPFDLDAIVAAAGPRSRRSLLPELNFGSRFALAGAVAILVVAVLVVAEPFVSRPGGLATSSPSASAVARFEESPAPTPSPRNPLEPLRLLAPAAAGELIRTRSATLSGVLIAVSGRLEIDPVACGPSKACGAAVLIGSGNGITIRPMGDVGPGPWDGSGPLVGAFVLRLTGDTENGRATAEFVGLLTTPPSGGPAWFVQDIIEGAAHVEGSYAAVQGWLVRGPVHPCPSNPRNPVVSYGCPTDDWLSESEFQPLQPNGSTVGPPAAIYLSSGSYDRWAPNPEPTGPDGRGVEPREATYLLQLVSDGCNDFADCLPPPPTWRIVGRFDPWPDTVAPSPDPTRLDNTVPAPSGDAWTVAQLADRPLGDGTFVVRGWLVGTPALRCPKAAAPSGEPDYSCNEVDWLTDEAFQPWFADGSTGGTREPALGIRVQNGAYAAFAPSPATGEFAARTPRFGDWVVRETTRGRSCSIGSACAVPTIHWEVIARLP